MIFTGGMMPDQIVATGDAPAKPAIGMQRPVSPRPGIQIAAGGGVSTPQAETMPNGPMAFAPMPHTPTYDTPLAAAEQPAFDAWAKQETARRGGRDVNQDKQDYDIQGFWKSGQSSPQGAEAHYTDQFKKPNHPTFSDQSQYALGTGLHPGSWDQGAFGRDRFTAGATNLQNMGGPAGMRDYFRHVEPGVSLDMPSASILDRLRTIGMPVVDPFLRKAWP